MMSRYEMFGGMDPYDLLITMQDRLNTLEMAHNNLAAAYKKQHEDISVLLASVNTLQKGHLNHGEMLNNIGIVLTNLNVNIELWREQMQKQG